MEAFNTTIKNQLQDLAQMEETIVDGYRKALGDVDTPEMADKLRVQLKDHEAHLREICTILNCHEEGITIPEVSEEDEIDRHLGSSPLGDTLDTYRALEEILALEKIAHERYRTLAKTNSPENPGELKEFLDRACADETHHHDFLEKASVSLKAAVVLWGPVDQPPILHY
jgi:bacterioferritin (cytochrome b1)